MISPISAPRDAVGMCLLGDKLYAVGGYDGQHYLKDVEAYDPINNEWTKVCTSSIPFDMSNLFKYLALKLLTQQLNIMV